jgi:hypothetical protein
MKRIAMTLATVVVAAGLSSIAAAEDQVGAPSAPSPAVSPVPVVPGTPAPPTVETAPPAPQGASPGVADLSEAQEARAALDELIRAYETGNLALLQARLDPAMIGYQRFVDGARVDANRLKQIRIHLFDTETTIGPDVAVIQSNWEKRFIDVVTFQPGQFSGNSKFLLQRKPRGWTVIAFAGDNLFSSASGAVGQLRINGGATTVALPPILDLPAVPVTIELIDPDMAGSHRVTVDATTTLGDRETLTLTETTPGRFTYSAGLRYATTPSIGNGTLEANVPATLTLRYLDRNPGNNRPPSTVGLNIAIR